MIEITNKSMAAMSVQEHGRRSFPLPANSVLRTDAKKLTIRVSHLPCAIEVEEKK
ncbi:hypothetical protein ES703_12688 [subsurface metagenome]